MASKTSLRAADRIVAAVIKVIGSVPGLIDRIVAAGIKVISRVPGLIDRIVAAFIKVISGSQD